ncbi:methyltransferase domain-containing protein [Paenibacillus sp. S-12]|uniref:methyltransferase domain-containing protein n=1 Tax=Paenibacillus sp. S-12 TaxID=3031371 RepID=UPI0025A0B3F6|nr:methyltransferase domain-containing protein [Paenibacillus sp. S-12]
MIKTAAINSKDYWDKRFEENWEPYSGRKQTLYFCNIAYDLFPEWLKAKLTKGVSFADVGCAEGDGTNFFADKFPNSRFTGIDFSEVAINKAKLHYPDQDFMQADIAAVEKKFDVVFSSNTLEHFVNPFEKLSYLFKISNQYTILLLPFQEYDRFEEHFYTFDYKDFKINKDGFSVVFAQEFDCSRKPNIYWAGKQLLIIYAHSSVFEQHEDLNLGDYIHSLSDHYTRLTAELETSKLTINELSTQITQQQTTIANQQDTIQNIYEENKRSLEKLEQVRYEKNKETLELQEGIKIKNEYIEKLVQEIKEAHDSSLLLDKEMKDNENQIEWLLNEKYKLDIELQNIKSSRFWKVATKYYFIRDRIPFTRKLYRALGIWKRYGFKTLIQQLKLKLTNRGQTNQYNSITKSVYERIMSDIESGELTGVTVIPSAFEFKELYNQRTINLAKYLAKKKIVVLFVVWQWSKDEIVPNSHKEVYPNIYHVPFFDFTENVELLELFGNITNKNAILNIPSKEWSQLLLPLKKYGFRTTYDIMDDWEEFNLVGQAPWYDKIIEESVILNVENVAAVSMPLVEKFSHLRGDISCIGNGYYSELLGEKNRNIACGTLQNGSHIKVGYFGHLTESWFDWDLVEKMLLDPCIFIEIIGYGASEETIKKMSHYSNFKYLGKVEPSRLSEYVKSWDIGMIPFILSKLSTAVDPIKVYEYIYFGLKVISTGIPHLENYPNVYTFDKENTNVSVSEFIKEISSIEVSDETESEIDVFLKATTWEKRFQEMLERQNIFFSEIYNNE